MQANVHGLSHVKPVSIWLQIRAGKSVSARQQAQQLKEQRFDKVINDIKRREIPRFSDAPIGQSTLECIEKLQKYQTDLPQKLQSDLCSWLKDFKIQDMTLLTDLQQMALISAEIQEIGSLQAVDFKTSFAAVYDRQVIEEELEDSLCWFAFARPVHVAPWCFMKVF